MRPSTMSKAHTAYYAIQGPEISTNQRGFLEKN